MGQTEERDEIVTVLPNAMRSTRFQKSGHAQIHTWPSGGLLLAQGRNQQNPASPAPPPPRGHPFIDQACAADCKPHSRVHCHSRCWHSRQRGANAKVWNVLGRASSIQLAVETL